MTMRMKKPSHPGQIIRSELEYLNLSVTKAAMVLGVTRGTLSNLINFKSGISPEMSIRLEKVLGSTADTWLAMQTSYDLAQAEKDRDKIKVNKKLMEDHKKEKQPILL